MRRAFSEHIMGVVLSYVWNCVEASKGTRRVRAVVDPRLNMTSACNRGTRRVSRKRRVSFHRTRSLHRKKSS